MPIPACLAQGLTLGKNHRALREVVKEGKTRPKALLEL